MTDAPILSDDAMYEMVAARRPGAFFLGVVTTGVFCRPGCPARTPRRENVRFFAGPGEALRAGFRPCLKCRPLGAAPEVEAATRIARAIEAEPQRRWAGADLAEASGLGPRAARRAFESALGLTPTAFRDAVRLRGYKACLRAGDSATQAGYAAGYGGAAARHQGQAALGMNAKAYAARGAGERIEAVQAETPLGVLTLGATPKGVCWCKLSDDAEGGFADLASEFSGAEIDRVAPGPETLRFADAVAAFLDGRAPRPDLPVDLRGTAFQMQVWAALQAIPAGETPTYGQIAARIGRPGASRAVGSANGANKVAVIVPCHLVVAAGGLGGYAGGLKRKQALLDLEAAAEDDAASTETDASPRRGAS